MAALAAIAFATAAAGFCAGWLLSRNRTEAVSCALLADRLEALLPQTQCGQCTFAGCRPYAMAMATGTAGPDQCPPGGHETAARLAKLLGRRPVPVDRTFGDADAPAQVAWIDEDRCIGCARCLPVCPVDAIVGAPRYLHTVIAVDCTGCKLCIPPCPVDCIDLVPAHATGVPALLSRARLTA